MRKGLSYRSFPGGLEGEMKIVEAARSAKAAGYDGYCTAELIPAYQHVPAVRWENATRATDVIFGLGSD